MGIFCRYIIISFSCSLLNSAFLFKTRGLKDQRLLTCVSLISLFVKIDI